MTEEVFGGDTQFTCANGYLVWSWHRAPRCGVSYALPGQRIGKVAVYDVSLTQAQLDGMARALAEALELA
jgi:hypothetical protein